MQLLAVSYQNIGPFLNRTLTVSFQQGKYLIKAPIGSGKSFLFFDGPVFGLYKYGGRTMLSMKAKEGFIKLLFEAGGNYYLIVRSLSRTKSGGDGVKSRLFSVSNMSQEQLTALLPEIINENLDIEEVLRTKGVNIDEEVFKNEIDLQQNLGDFLPPREVFTSTTFLMQDSENMFEMTPANRINVFKNIFGLLDIDEAKDIIANAKKETNTLLRSRSNTDDVNSKLHRLVSEYISIVRDNNEKLTDEIISHVGDWELVQDRLGIENFDLASLPLASWQELAVKYDQQRSQYQSQLGQLQTLQKQYATTTADMEKIVRQKSDAERKIGELEKNLQTDNTEAIKKLQDEKKSLLTEQEEIKTSLRLTERGFASVMELISYKNQLIQKGTEAKNSKINIEQKLEHIEEKLKNIDVQRKNLEQQKNLVKETEVKKEFFCKRIDENCPFIAEIAVKVFNQKAQEDFFAKQEAALDSSKLEAEKIKISTELQSAETELNKIGKEYKDFDFPTIDENIKQYSALDIKREANDKQLASFEKEKDLHEKYREELTATKISITHYDESVIGLTKQQQELQTELDTLRNATDINALDSIEAILSSTVRAMKLLETISELVGTHKNNMLVIKQLEEKEAMLGQLFSIFSKEIMIYVLQQTLPLFADVLNNLLAKVVDYTVSFETATNSDKIELEIKVHDAKGERLVKSLSGGQKTILRLTRTFAVCIFTRSNALFLDETVNNIDKETIGKVADLIDDFTKTHALTFYMITHSETIQEMEIWDKVISL